VLSFRRKIPTTTRLSWFDRSGTRRGDIGPAGAFTQPVLSPDEKQLAIVLADAETGNRDIWLMNLGNGALTRFTFNAANDWCPLWSPDGKSVIFASDRTPRSSIFRKPLSGGAEEMLLTGGQETGMFATSISADGELLIFQKEGGAATGIDLGLLPLTGARQPRIFLATQFLEHSGALSPDGSSLAYISNESGTSELYVSPLHGSGKTRVSTAGARHVQWRRDGRELFYDAPDGWLMAAALRSGQALEFDSPKRLFQTCEGARTLRGVEKFFDISADATRFLLACATDAGRQGEITVQIGWQQMLKRASQ
jgi:Tol biopolymer transport system component